jgi:hypothetical protein
MRCNEPRIYCAAQSVKNGVSSSVYDMNLTISIPDEIFARADREAQRQGLPTDELFAQVLAEHFLAQEHESITARLDAVCGEADHSDDEKRFLRRAASKAASAVDW